MEEMNELRLTHNETDVISLNALAQNLLSHFQGYIAFELLHLLSPKSLYWIAQLHTKVASEFNSKINHSMSIRD
jgi:hypothetical protein